jgi:hypothetical protein
LSKYLLEEFREKVGLRIVKEKNIQPLGKPLINGIKINSNSAKKTSNLSVYKTLF